jgi:peptide-methionine (S)-S-oxide reductase
MMVAVLLEVTLVSAGGWDLYSLIAGQDTSGEMLPIPDETKRPEGAETATFAAGCFWCVEEVFHQVDGVLSAVSGYMGGTAEDAHYQMVAAGRTDHAESVQVIYDPARISYRELLDWFFKLHDPTQVNRQGPDVGRQYRSAIFYHSDDQRAAAETAKKQLNDSKTYSKPIATEIVAATTFYPAEAYHQNYARLNPHNGYIQYQLVPKLKKLGLAVPN